MTGEAPANPVLYNPFAPGFRENPYPFLHELRKADPIHWSLPVGYWVLTRYEDIKFVLSDPRFAIALELLERSPSVRQEPPLAARRSTIPESASVRRF